MNAYYPPWKDDFCKDIERGISKLMYYADGSEELGQVLHHYIFEILMYNHVIPMMEISAKENKISIDNIDYNLTNRLSEIEILLIEKDRKIEDLKDRIVYLEKFLDNENQDRKIDESKP